MKLSNADVQWREDELPYSSQYEDVYFSRDDAVAESQHVFIDANKLLTRFGALTPAQHFVIGELGFGSGLNFMQSVALWRRTAPAGTTLHYLAFEKHPLRHADLARLHANWPQFKAIGAELLAQYPDHSSGCHRLHLAGGILLDLYYGDASEQLTASSTINTASIDCWFLDGFSPARNPALWQESLMQQIAASCKPGASLSTYSVAGSVRQSLTAAGFTPVKAEGFGRKRHMLLASLTQQAQETADKPVDTTPWQRRVAAVSSTTAVSTNVSTTVTTTPASTKGHAVVIGAGLAGCSSAYSLSQRGWQVTVVDSADSPAAGASGNQQMALRCRLFRSESALAEYFLHSFLYAGRQFERLQAESDIGWQRSGVIELRQALNKSSPFSQAELGQLYDSRVLQTISAIEASRFAGLELTSDGWLLPAGGWLDPSRLCARYLEHDAIAFQGNFAVKTLQRVAGVWQVAGTDEAMPSLSADVVVIANSANAQHIAQSSYLPLIEVWGQITQVPSTSVSKQLSSVVSGERTVFPALAGQHTVAASYAPSNLSSAPSAELDQENLHLARSNFVAPNVLSNIVATARTSFRCNTEDRSPVVGALANNDQVKSIFSGLAKNAKRTIEVASDALNSLHYPGLYINVAHGSNGLASAPFSAEILASLIDGENLPCNSATLEALNPVRFPIRDLKKQR